MKNNLTRKFNLGLKKLKWKGNDLLYSSKLKQLNINSSERRILIYHGVTNNARTDINTRFISTQLFEKQILYFKNNFHIVSLSDYFSGSMQKGKLTLALTFDDGYLNNLTEVLPILEKYQIPATFFITTIRKAGYEMLWPDIIDLYCLTGPDKITFQNRTYRKRKNEYRFDGINLKQKLKNSPWFVKKDLIDSILDDNQFTLNEEFFPYFKTMNEEEIALLSNSQLVEIGSHGLFHNNLEYLSLEEFRNEIIESKSYLEKVTQKKVESIAFPDGSYTREIVDIAESVGYKRQLAVDFLFPIDFSDKRIESRFGINPYISFNNQIACIINGKY